MGCELLSINAIFDIRNNEVIFFSWEKELWIAFNKCYLWYSKQLNCSRKINNTCCELLSINAIFDIRNNLFEVLSTLCQLWIAFNKCYLWYSKQLDIINCFHSISCELLSINAIFDIRNNDNISKQYQMEVVNCFQ